MALCFAAKFFWFVLFQFLTLLLFTYYGMMAVSVSPSVQMAAVISSAFYSIWFLFTGRHPACCVPSAQAWHWRQAVTVTLGHDHWGSY